MKTSVRIAKLELSTLFYSPIPWILIVVFLFQCTLTYVNTIENYLIAQELHRGFRELTMQMMGPPYGIVKKIIASLYLYLPLLTMGIMSREFSNGTIKLLYSSPATVWQIITGKFLALTGLNFLMVMMLGVILVAARINIHHADSGLLFSFFLGTFLAISAYAAIGLFMSCLTSYQVVAAIGTLALLAVLESMGDYWQDNDLFRELTHIFAISGRTENFLYGLITSRDVIYFLLIVFLFLGLSTVKLNSQRSTRSRLHVAGRYAAVFLTTILIGYLSALPDWIAYWDSTATLATTISPKAQEAMKEMDKGPLKVTAYVNLLDNNYRFGQASNRYKYLSYWEPYQRFKADIQYDFVYYYDTSESYADLQRFNPGLAFKELSAKIADARQTSLSKFRSPEEIRKIIDLRPENNRFLMKLDYNNKSAFLRVFNDPRAFPDETEVAGAVKRLTSKAPVVGFLTGDLERNIEKNSYRDYRLMAAGKSFRQSLLNAGFDLRSISPDTCTDIPQDLSVLVIADPRREFTEATREKINRYIESGGNLFIMGEPGKQHLLNPLLSKLGVQLMDGMLMQQSKDLSPYIIKARITAETYALSGRLRQIRRDALPVLMTSATGLLYQAQHGFSIFPLLVTDSASTWNEKGTVVLDSTQVSYSPEEGERKGEYAIAIAMKRKIKGKEQRIVIAGDADFLSDAEFERSNMVTANYKVNPVIIGWFSGGRLPVDNSRPELDDDTILLTTDSIRWLRVLLAGVLPGSILAAGMILLIRRRRQ